MTDFVPQFELAGNFTSIPNHVLRDPRLSDKAKGRMAYLASHRVGYRLTITQQIAETKGGRDSVYAALKELIGLDYLKRTQKRSEDGKLGPVVYEWGPAAVEQQYERAWGESSQVTSTSGKAVTGGSGSGHSGSGRSAAKKNNLLEEQPKENQSKTKSSGTVGAGRTVRNARGRTSAAPPREKDSSSTSGRRTPSASPAALALFARLPRPWQAGDPWLRARLIGRLDSALGTWGADAIASYVAQYAPDPAHVIDGKPDPTKVQHLTALVRVLSILATDVSAGTCPVCGTEHKGEGCTRSDPEPSATLLNLVPGVCIVCDAPEATARDGLPYGAGSFVCDPCWAGFVGGEDVGRAA